MGSTLNDLINDLTVIASQAKFQMGQYMGKAWYHLNLSINII